MRNVGEGQKRPVPPAFAHQADRVVEVSGVLPVDRDKRKPALVDTGKVPVPVPLPPPPCDPAPCRDAARFPECPFGKFRGYSPRRGDGERNRLHGVALSEKADDRRAAILSSRRVFRDLGQNEFPRLRVQPSGNCHRKVKIRLPVAEADKPAVSHRGISPHEFPDAPFADPDDPAIGRSAYAPFLYTEEAADPLQGGSKGMSLELGYR